MSYVNLASLTKRHRATQIITDIGADGFMSLYTGTHPASPDAPATGTLLAILSLSSVSGVASLAVQQASITARGTGGTNGTYDLTFIDGGGTGATGFYIVANTVLETITITDYGHGYTDKPLVGGFGAAGLTGASALAVMTAMVTFNSIIETTAVATGVIGWARINTSDNIGIIDLDVGTTNAASVVVDNTFVLTGGAVACSAEVLIEA